MSIVIDAEFAGLIPPLTAEERQQLETNIIEHGGARDPLVVWDSGAKQTLLDGHNRYEICTRLDLPYNVERLEFEGREAAADWIDRNQLGRRNLKPEQLSLLRGRRYNRTKKPGRPSEQPGQNVRVSAESLAAEHGVNEKTIRRDGEFADAVETLGIEHEVVSGKLDIPKRDIVAAAKALPDEPTPEQVREVVEVIKSRPHVANNSGDNEWYTPREYIEAARDLMGQIDLDPASNPVANDIVKAKHFYTAEDSGLDKDWSGNVWMNPPYESGLIGKFVEKLGQEYDAGNVTQAVVLVNNATETKWFQSLASRASAVCFPCGRVKFWHPEKVATPLQGQAVLYFGSDFEEFNQMFGVFGIVAEIMQ